MRLGLLLLLSDAALSDAALIASSPQPRACSRRRAAVAVAALPRSGDDCVGEECETRTGAAAAATGVSGGKTIDLRRGRTGRAGSGPEEGRNYGRDPREVKGKPEVEAEQAAAAAAEGSHPSHSNREHVAPLRSTADLEAAITSAGDRLVVVKFFARWCKSCKATKPRYERLAAKLSSSCDFFEVDYAASRSFCDRCYVRFMPCVHVYAAGELSTATSLSVQRFSGFATQLEADAKARSQG